MIRVRGKGAAQCLREINAAILGIEAELEQLGSKMDELESKWNGEAREAFQRAMVEWGRSMSTLKQLGTNANQGAAAALGAIHAQDQRRSKAWKRS